MEVRPAGGTAEPSVKFTRAVTGSGELLPIGGRVSWLDAQRLLLGVSTVLDLRTRRASDLSVPQLAYGAALSLGGKLLASWRG